MPNGRCRLHGGFQHTAARRRLDYIQVLTNIHIDSFNTQPPEGGWTGIISIASSHTVSTHSRPKAAGTLAFAGYLKRPVSTHSRPKAAGLWCLFHFFLSVVSTHSRPKAAGFSLRPLALLPTCFNTQPPEGGWVLISHGISRDKGFQHTAARRRLGFQTACNLS